jgi:hypothetical protein
MTTPKAKSRGAWLLLVPGIILVLAIAAQAWGGLREVAVSRGPHLEALMPPVPAGWTVREVPLGRTEFLQGEVERILNYDDVLYREYRRGDRGFEVYVAYWGAGKMPTRLVASHTPDRCWTENGWRCLEMKFKQVKQVGGTTLQPGEWRRFLPPAGGAETYVLYWHLVDGEVYDYGERFNAVPDPFRWWKDAVQQAVLGSREQYFVRLTSLEPLETWWTDPTFVEVVRSLKGIGLAAEAAR